MQLHHQFPRALVDWDLPLRNRSDDRPESVEPKGFGIERLRHHWDSSERLRFLLVGGYNTAFGYGSFVLLYLLLGNRLHYLALVAISHVLSVTNAFAAHRWLTFAARGSLWMQYLRFNVTNLGLIALNLMLTGALVEGLGWHPLAASAVAIPVTIVASYVLHRAFSFRD
jgi:putative flippase GtrA